ncbi:MAG: TIR domain-containing protein [Pseudomonadota bacterium]
MGHHDVFISYSREDRPKVEKLANALTERGMHVWWDPKIKTGAGFRQEIAEALSSSKTVIVVWSRYSVASRFVADEADEGAARDILFPALIDNVDIPLGFRQIQTADLTHWRGNLNDNAFKAFLAAVAEGAHTSSGAPNRRPEPAPEVHEPTPETPAPEKPKPAPKPRAQKPKPAKQVKSKYTTTGSQRRLALFGQAVFMAALIAGAFGALAYASDFVFQAYRPFFIGAMGVLAFLSRYGTLEADRAAGAASLALLPRSYLALLLFSLIAISPLVLEGRLYAAALEGVKVRGIEGADINNVTLDQNGERLITSSDDNIAKLWDTRTGVEISQYFDHRSNCQSFNENGRPQCWVWGADVSPAGDLAVSASRDLTARIWRTATGEAVRTLAGHKNSVYDAVWSPDGTAIATASGDGTIIIWDPETGEPTRTLTGHNGDVRALDFNPVGDRLVSGGEDGRMMIWNWREGRRIGYASAGAMVNDVKFSGDGSMIAAAADNGAVRVWRTSDRGAVASVNHGARRAFAVAFVDSDRAVASGGIDEVIRIWSISTGALLTELTGHQGAVRALDASPDGGLLVSGSRDNTARVWSVASGRNRVTMGHIRSAIDLPVSLDLPPVFVSSQAPVPVDFSKDKEFAGQLIGKGFAVAAALLIAALLAKGFFWVIGLRPVARLSVVGTLFVAAAYVGVLIAATLPVEALALWLTIAFVPATLFALLRWLWRGLILSNLNPRTRGAR